MATGPCLGSVKETLEMHSHACYQEMLTIEVWNIQMLLILYVIDMIA